MDAKLTLKLDTEIIAKAKEYAAKRKKSLSKMIEAYLHALINKEKVQTVEEPEITPFVKSLSSGVHIPDDLDPKQEYRKHKEERHS
ncbi:MAG TPA: DUF6364 family protein [Bacteroidales bacterium]|nr:DUF6364 family protein [Bacteroidales bacterium]HRZ48568.1 DUF6364 family protein [Bacteroidales bacterium]